MSFRKAVALRAEQKAVLGFRTQVDEVLVELLPHRRVQVELDGPVRLYRFVCPDVHVPGLSLFLDVVCAPALDADICEVPAQGVLGVKKNDKVAHHLPQFRQRHLGGSLVVQMLDLLVQLGREIR